MSRPAIFVGLLVLAFVSGCGGGGGGGHHLDMPGEISGLVLDQDGNIVRDATVYIDNNHKTYSNSNGMYILTDVHRDEVLLKASDNQDGVDYYGEQVVELFSGERTKTANITVVQESKLASVQGTVHTNGGQLVEGARIYFNSGLLTSTYTISDRFGNYRVDTLVGGFNYDVKVTGAGFNAGSDTVTPTAGNTSELDLVLGTATDPNLSPPTGVSAIAWTSPAVLTPLVARTQNAYERIKQLIDHRRVGKKVQARSSDGGNPIEIDIYWTPITNSGLLGYGIYRKPSASAGQLVSIDFYKDPFAGLYEDIDDFLVDNSSYDYAVTSINSSFLDGSSHGESGFSSIVSAATLSDLPVDAVTNGPVTFHWHSGSGATSYQVFVFDDYPSLGIDPIWTSASVGGTSTVYGGPALSSGITYYFIVVGAANSDTSFTLSPVLQFTAP